MIRGLHGLFYSSEPEAARNFLRDKLKLPYSDVGEGWLIFDLPEGDLGIHPVDPGQAGGGHDVSFYCDDLPGTVADLKSRGVEFDGDIADHGYGLVTYFRIPGGLRVQLYEPRYQKRSMLPPRTAKKAVKKTAKTAKKAAKTAKTAVKKVAAKASRVVAKAKPAAKRGSTAKRGR
jgi:glyoxalase/bleomycin resistance protein/dioxygenase superfamily protein